MKTTFVQGTAMITMIKKDEDDKRRHQARCIFYRKKYKDQKDYCQKNFSTCIGSAHCNIYMEKELEEKKNNISRQTISKLVPTEKKKMSDHEGLKIFPKGCRIRHAKFGSGMIPAKSRNSVWILVLSRNYLSKNSKKGSL